MYVICTDEAIYMDIYVLQCKKITVWIESDGFGLDALTTSCTGLSRGLLRTEVNTHLLES